MPKAQKGLGFTMCKICKENVSMLTHVHMMKHGITQLEYCFKHPEQADTVYWGDEPGHKSIEKFKKIRLMIKEKDNAKVSKCGDM